MTFYSYVDRQNNLIVKRLMSPQEVQDARKVWRRYLGQFDAPDHAQARKIAQEIFR